MPIEEKKLVDISEKIKEMNVKNMNLKNENNSEIKEI